MQNMVADRDGNRLTDSHFFVQFCHLGNCDSQGHEG